MPSKLDCLVEYVHFHRNIEVSSRQERINFFATLDDQTQKKVLRNAINNYFEKENRGNSNDYQQTSLQNLKFEAFKFSNSAF